MLLPDVTNASDLAHIAEILVASVGKPHTVGEMELTVTPPIGVTIWPTDGDDLNTLIKNADLAMYQPLVQLKSGGYLVINPTEALVSIDINSGRRGRHHRRPAPRRRRGGARPIRACPWVSRPVTVLSLSSRQAQIT